MESENSEESRGGKREEHDISRGKGAEIIDNNEIITMNRRGRRTQRFGREERRNKREHRRANTGKRQYSQYKIAKREERI